MSGGSIIFLLVSMDNYLKLKVAYFFLDVLCVDGIYTSRYRVGKLVIPKVEIPTTVSETVAQQKKSLTK